VLFDPAAPAVPTAFVAKYSAAGNLRWGRQFGGGNGGSAGGVSSDPDGNVVVAGYNSGALHGNTALGLADMVVVKFDGDGNRLWTRQLGTAVLDIASTVAVDADGRIYVGGRSAGAMTGSANAGLLDAVLVHLDTDGSTRWIRQFGSAADDFIWSIAVDGTSRAVVAGWAGGALPGQSHLGGVDAFTGVYAADGSLAWLRQWGTAEDDYAYGTTLGAAGQIISAGYTSGALDGMANLGESDVIVVRHAADGTPR
jgi:Beta-propeller repeat